MAVAVAPGVVPAAAAAGAGPPRGGAVPAEGKQTGGAGFDPQAELAAKRTTKDASWRTRFLQQELPAVRPIPSVRANVGVPLLLGIANLIVGAAMIAASKGVVEVSIRYDDVEACRDAHVTSGGETVCTVQAVIQKDMHGPVFVHYGLDRFHQNARRYATSSAYAQYHFPDRTFQTAELHLCLPELFLGSTGYDGAFSEANDLPNGGLITPCGLVAWTFFNDTYQLGVARFGTTSEPSSPADEVLLAFDAQPERIARRNDLSLFGPVRAENYNPDAFPQFRGGGTANRMLNDEERLITWMRLAARPKFRKPYARLDAPEDGAPVFRAGDVVSIGVHNRYDTYRFGGTKTVVLTTLSWYGGRHEGAGWAFVCSGVAMLVLAAALAGAAYGTREKRRQYADPSALSWLAKRARD